MKAAMVAVTVAETTEVAMEAVAMAVVSVEMARAAGRVEAVMVAVRAAEAMEVAMQAVAMAAVALAAVVVE